MEVPGNSACSSNEVVVLDFETTGLTPLYHRTIEVGAVLVCRNRIERTFSELMDPGSYIPAFITSLTGISDDMVEGKPAPEEVMPRLREFIGERPIVAHNASFDRRFLTAEMERAGLKLRNPVLCTLLLSRRLIPESPGHKLGILASHLGIKIGRAHRALDDARATAELWIHLRKEVERETGKKMLDASIYQRIATHPRHRVPGYLDQLAQD